MRWILAPLILATCLWCSSFGQEIASDFKYEIDQAEQTLKKAKLKVDTESLLDFFKHRTLSAKDEQKLNFLVKQLGDTSYTIRATATAQLLKFGTSATTFLKEGLKADDQEIVRRAELVLQQIEEKSDSDVVSAAVFLLGERKADGAAKILMDYLPFANSDEVFYQVRQALPKVAVKNEKADPSLVAALNDKYSIRRAMAGEALAKVENQRDAVLALLKDPDAEVRLTVSLALAKAKDHRGLPVLIKLLEQLHPDDVWQAEEALIRIAGETAPIPPPNKDLKPADLRKSWETWLKDNKEIGKLLADYASAPSYLKYTLVTEMPLQGGLNGYVLEMGPKENTLWQITNLRYPVDAEIVGHKHVLVAEYLNRRVVEFDFKGNVKWFKEIDQPVGCQRLPNGNTFIAARRQLLEVNRAGKEVFSYGSPNMYIATARKMPNGEILMVNNIGQLTHLDSKGKQINTFKVGRVYTLGGHIDVLPGGKVLVPEYQNNLVREYNLKGEVKWEIKVNNPTCAVRLPNGNTLVTSMISQQIMEFDQKGNIVWQYRTAGRPWCARRR